MPIDVITGRAGSGKTQMLCQNLLDVLRRNEKYRKRTGILRQVHTNFPLTEQYSEKYKEFLVVHDNEKYVKEMSKLEDCDIFIDELLYHFDAVRWKELDIKAKRFIAIHRHLGIEIYSTSQDFAQVDIAFRRLTDRLYYLVKIVSSREPSATKPPVKRIWGLSIVYTIPPTDYKEDQKENKTSWSSFFLITRRKCEVYDTRQKYAVTELSDMECLKRWCEDDECPIHGRKHGRPKYIHQ